MQAASSNNRGLWIALAILVFALVVIPALGGGMMGYGMMGPGGMWGYWGGLFAGAPGIGIALGMIGMLLFWGALIVAAVLGVRALAGLGQQPPRAETPMDALRRRYAAGEITREDFLRISQDIEESGRRPAA